MFAQQTQPRLAFEIQILPSLHNVTTSTNVGAKEGEKVFPTKTRLFDKVLPRLFRQLLSTLS